jgi:hypothetical protein
LRPFFGALISDFLAAFFAARLLVFRARLAEDFLVDVLTDFLTDFLAGFLADRFADLLAFFPTDFLTAAFAGFLPTRAVGSGAACFLARAGATASGGRAMGSEIRPSAASGI